MTFHLPHSPGPLFRRVNDKGAVTLLGGQRALLLQLAHPLVAAGVRDHSHFLSDPLGRLIRTLDFMHALIFGTEEEKEKAVLWFRSVHAPIQGKLKEHALPFGPDTPYTASSPPLLLWVWATLVDTAPLVYQRAVSPLTARQRAAFYRDSREWAMRLGIPAKLIPATWQEFQAYMRTTLSRLSISPTARKLASHVLFPPGMPLILSFALALVTVELLPPPVRKGYGLRHTEVQKTCARFLLSAVHLLWPLIPKRFQSAETLRSLLLRLAPQGSPSGSTPERTSAKAGTVTAP